MFYYINNTCLNLNKLLCLSKSLFNTPVEQDDTDGESTIVYTLNVLFENSAQPLVITYLNEEDRDKDFVELATAVHGYGKPE